MNLRGLINDDSEHSILNKGRYNDIRNSVELGHQGWQRSLRQEPSERSKSLRASTQVSGEMKGLPEITPGPKQRNSTVTASLTENKIPVNLTENKIQSIVEKHH
jgi:hypothetical protein